MKSSISTLCSVLMLMALSFGCGTMGKTKSTGAAPSPHHDRYVVILSLDGFRADYQQRAHTPNLDKMDAEGLSGRFRPS